MEQTRTELHTHLLGMLSAKELLKMVQEYTDYIYWPLDKGISEDTRLVSISDVIENESSCEQLMIKHGKRVSYEQLDTFYNSRTAILNYLISLMVLNNNEKPVMYKDLLLNDKYRAIIFDNIMDGDINYSDSGIQYMMALMEYAKKEKQSNRKLEHSCKKHIFSSYINKALRELIKMGVKYVEISYSYEDVISMIEIDPEIAKEIKCKFLLSTGRDRSIKQMCKSAEGLKIALSKGMTVGFDIMGQEVQLTDKEKTYETGKKSKSFKRKLEILINTLIANNDLYNTLRIHSGESPVSFGNTEWILNTLYEIKNEYLNMTPSRNILPPPELRIGHGIYFEKNDNYIKRLKDFGAIIEINASSNIALNNIDNFSLLPYDYYLKNGIPIVISTDGHGLYDTNIKIEDYIAQTTSKYYDAITQADNAILEGKKKR